MTESIGGLVPVGTLLDGITADQIGEHDPSGQTFIRLLGAIEYHARSRSTRWLNTSIWPRRAATRSIAMVMRLILEDEECHHGLLKRISSTLRDARDWTYSPDACPKLESESDGTTGVWQDWSEAASPAAVRAPRIQLPAFVYQGSSASHLDGQHCDLVDPDDAGPGAQAVIFACGCVGHVPMSSLVQR